MLTFSFNSSHSLIGCGVDGESVTRFTSLVNVPQPFPFVFSQEETEYIQGLADPAEGFCAAFCCKEAVFKALGKPFNYTDCQFFHEEDKEIQHPVFTTMDEFSRIADCQVRIISTLPGELVAIVHLFSTP